MTGYTHQIVEKNISFPEFVMSCARNFGACLSMRDDPMDSPIPEVFKASEYSKVRLGEVKNELKTLLNMGPLEQIGFGQAKKEEKTASYEKLLRESIEENNKLRKMLEQVNAWEPPTKDHINLKDFMQEQINKSFTTDFYIENKLEETKNTSAQDFFNEALRDAQRDVVYFQKSYEEDEERARMRTNWIQQLRESLKATA